MIKSFLEHSQSEISRSEKLLRLLSDLGFEKEADRQYAIYRRNNKEIIALPNLDVVGGEFPEYHFVSVRKHLDRWNLIDTEHFNRICNMPDYDKEI